MNSLFFTYKQTLQNKAVACLQILIVAIIAAVLTLLATFIRSLDSLESSVSENRIITQNSVSVMRAIPEIYQRLIKAMDSVESSTHVSWIGAYYLDKKNSVTALVVDAETFLDVYPIYKLPRDQQENFIHSNNGMIVGRKIADKYGWKINQKVVLGSEVFPKSNGDNDWQFYVKGIFESERSAKDEEQVFINYAYFDKERMYGQHQVSWVVSRIKPGYDLYKVSNLIENKFYGSPNEVLTTTEKNLSESYVSQVNDIKNITIAIILVATFSMSIVIVSTFLHQITTNKDTYNLLRHLGFCRSLVMRMGVLSTVCISGVGVCVGYLVSLTSIKFFEDSIVSILPGIRIKYFDYTVLAILLVMIAVNILVSFLKIRNTVKY